MNSKSTRLILQLSHSNPVDIGLRDKWHRVGDIKWLPEEDRVKLEQNGIITNIDLTLTPLKQLTRIGISEHVGHRLLKEVAGEMNISTQAGANTISTGSSALDRMLGGGVRVGEVTDFFGPSGSGKTQLCFQLCVNLLRSEVKKRATYLDTMGTFRPERIVEIADSSGADGKEMLRRISVVAARSVSQQVSLARRLLSGEDVGTRLLILDTVTENFLLEYQGEEALIERQSALAKHLHDLALLAIRKEMVVVLTNNVRTVVESVSGKRLVELGGSTLSQGVHLRIQLARERNKWRARLIRPFEDLSEALFAITKSGVRDLERSDENSFVQI